MQYGCGGKICRGTGGDTSQTWHHKFAGTGTSKTCKDKEEFKQRLE